MEDLGLSHGYLNFGSAAIPLSIGDRNVVGCVAYQRVIDLFNKDEVTLPNGNYEIKQTGGVDAISPSVGIQISPQFSIGVAYNIYVGATSPKWKLLLTDEEFDAPKETYSGGNVTLGGLMGLGMFRIGATYKSPYILKANQEQRLGVRGLVDFYEYEFEMKMPGMIGIGLMVEPTSNLRIAADYELRGFSNFETRFKGFEFEKPTEEFVDVNQLRLGAEYLFMSGSNVIPFRLGLKTEPRPINDVNGNQIIGAAITMGLGLVSHAFSLAATLEYSALTLKYSDYEMTTSQVNVLLSGIFYFGK